MSCSPFDFSTRTKTNVYKNFDFIKVVTYKNPDKTLIDLTNLEFTMVIKDSLGGSTLLTLSEVGDAVTTGLYIATPANGEVRILIASADSTGITAGNYPYEITYTDSNSLRHPFMEGEIEFTERGF